MHKERKFFASAQSIRFSKCFELGDLKTDVTGLESPSMAHTKPFADIVSANHWLCCKALIKSNILHRHKNPPPCCLLLIYVVYFPLLKSFIKNVQDNRSRRHKK